MGSFFPFTSVGPTGSDWYDVLVNAGLGGLQTLIGSNLPVPTTPTLPVPSTGRNTPSGTIRIGPQVNLPSVFPGLSQTLFAGVGRSRRRMNYCNPRALRRSIKRVQGFAKFAKKTVRITERVKLKKGRKSCR